MKKVPSGSCGMAAALLPFLGLTGFSLSAFAGGSFRFPLSRARLTLVARSIGLGSGQSGEPALARPAVHPRAAALSVPKVDRDDLLASGCVSS